MTHEPQMFTFPSLDKQTTIHAYEWVPQTMFGGRPRAIVQIAHGMAEHMRRYDELASVLNERGYLVCGNDHIGHGESVTSPSEYGHMPLEGGKDVLLADFHTTREIMQEKYGKDVPYFVYGHSMGSFVVRAYIEQFATGLSGAVLSGTAQNGARAAALARAMAKRSAVSHGDHSYNKTIHSFADGAYAKAVQNARTEFDWLSCDNDVVDKYIDDPACGFMFTVGGYATLMSLVEDICQLKNVQLVPKSLPIYLIAGKQDPVGDNGEGVKKAFSNFKQAGIADVSMKLYPDMRHEVHNEPGKQEVFADVLGWLDARLDSACGYVIALDQGTTSSRAVIFNHSAKEIASNNVHFNQYFPKPGWVEHNALEIWESQLAAIEQTLAASHVSANDIICMGITNQRETTIVWNRETGEPIAHAIVWQCRRTADMIKELCSNAAIAEKITAKTGLVPDAYFSASKLAWLLDNTPGAREAAEAGKLAFGTVDSWLVYKLTGGAVHATDLTNASRTMLFNIHTCQWDEELLSLFNIPESVLPEVRVSATDFGVVACGSVLDGVPIRGVAGDQQASLFGHCCFSAGEAKSTYGTGCFVLMNTGTEAARSTNKLVTTIAASAPGTGHVEYALEGSCFVCASLLQWVRDGLGIIKKSAETEEMARSVESTEGVYIIPAHTGLGAPYWDAQARGAILGLTRGTTKNHIARAALEALAYQADDLIKAMQADAGSAISALHVDGGCAKNNFLMQFQSDITGATIKRPANTEVTALGAAYLAGLSQGYWQSTDEILSLRSADTTFEPSLDASTVQELLDGWHNAVTRVLTDGE